MFGCQSPFFQINVPSSCLFSSLQWDCSAVVFKTVELPPCATNRIAQLNSDVDHVQADLEEAYILSAFKRKDDEFMADGRKADLSLEGQGQESEAEEDTERESRESQDQGSLPSVESLRATLQALRVQDRLARSGEAPLVSTVPTVPMAVLPMGTAPAECHALSDSQRLAAGEIEGSSDVIDVMNP